MRNRLFTTPPDLACTLRVREGHDDRTVPVAPGDAFALFLEGFIDAMGRRRLRAVRTRPAGRRGASRAPALRGRGLERWRSRCGTTGRSTEAEREDILAAVDQVGALGAPDPGRERPELRARAGSVLRRRPRGRRGQRHRCAGAGAAGARHAAGRRGDHDLEYRHPDRVRHRHRGGNAPVCRYRTGHLPDGCLATRRGHHRTDPLHSPGAPLRSMRGDGSRASGCRPPRDRRAGRLRAEHRGRSRQDDARDRCQISRRSPSTPPRSSAATATAVW